MQHSDPFDRVTGQGWVVSGEGEDVGAPPPLQRRGLGGGGLGHPLLSDAHHPQTPSSEEEGAYSPDPVFTPALKLRFLDELSQHGNVRVAAGRVGVSRSGAYLARRRDSAFAAAWRSALCLARDHAEAVLAERALEGVEEPVFFRGELIATRRRFDSRLLLAHLARLDGLCGAEEPAAGALDLAMAAVAGVELPGGLPQVRAAHVAAEAERAGEHFDAVTPEPDPDDPWDYEPFPGDEPEYENEAIRAAEEMAEAWDLADARYQSARAARVAAAGPEAGAAWDAAMAGVWAEVDAVRLGVPPYEVKSLGGFLTPRRQDAKRLRRA